ncbi:uncharacterized protein LOC133915695 [Phragmites australis]|uniref:uncharacterized protein LOC133915695 n=1 Tax=Phragmites australis TaxID=29695 RepID=UPI002D79F766|nr:uncharacterized protein LOC133915695 [Phragmites australis]
MAASPTASSSSARTASAAAAAAAAAEATDGPVLSVVSKRLRALRKKYNRIMQMEESLAAGKTLNREQEEVLRSKPVVVALIDELERLRAPLASALAEELSSRPAPAPAVSSSDSDLSIQDLLALVYFGSLFDVKPQSEFMATMVARTHERSCCITYDYVTDDAADLLVETDLDAVSALAALAASRPAAAAGVSHSDALQACAHHARLWLRRADEPIHPDSGITYAGVRAKLDKIMSSDYYTAQPEMRATEDVAAAVGSYGAGGVQAQEGMVLSPQAPATVEESVAVEGHKDEKEDSQATEIYTDHQSPLVDAQHVDDEAPVNPSDEAPSAEVEQERFEADAEDPEEKDQQFIHRRSYQNQRGGGRGGGRRGYANGRGGRGGRGVGGGYQNGRGGGGYQNGRGGSGGYYYDTGYYQQRNYNNRGRGGRSGGNSYYVNHGGSLQGGGHAHSGRVELGANA